METRRFLLAIVLMIATVVIINVLFPPARRAPSAPQADTVRVDSLPAQPARVDTARPTISAAQPTDSAQGAADTIVVQSPLYRFGISTRGAALVSVQLLQYASETVDGPVQLAPSNPRGLISYRLRADGQDIDLASIQFRADRTADLTLTPADRSASLRFVGNEPVTGRTIALTYRFDPNDYVIDVSATLDRAARGAHLLLGIGPTLAFNEATPGDDQRFLAYVVNSRRDGIRSVLLQSVRTDRTEEGPLAWVALKNKYFVVAAMPPAEEPELSFGGLLATDIPGRHRVDLTATLPFGGDETAAFRLYAGPQEQDRLAAFGNQLQDVNPYGWRWLQPIIRPLGHAFTWILLEAQRATGLAYGWVLILFGIAVRAALWPLNAKAMRSQMKNMELQPRIKDIQTRLKSSPEQMQRELLKLYREEGFNPMGGCLPLLLPMPVLITLFFVFQATIEFRGAAFLWLPDLSQRDPLYILPILLGVTMFIQQWLSMKTSPPNPQMKLMMWFMPAFMVILFLNFASGLNLYYAAQNVASFPQQLQLIRERQRYQAKRSSAPAKKA
ncbi:MAG TPA: membrane protein insertase YidC [Longimicrobiales bacterium]|nr:membrane protein insertase YidC [Longimicrobiales bacterium]